MPQMAPINWLFLFFMFLMTFIIFNIMNYFIVSPQINSLKSNTLKTSHLNWKW